MKKMLSLLLALLVLTGMIGALPVSAAGSATITASKSTVNVGGTVTVTAKYSGGSAYDESFFVHLGLTFPYHVLIDYILLVFVLNSRHLQ